MATRRPVQGACAAWFTIQGLLGPRSHLWFLPTVALHVLERGVLFFAALALLRQHPLRALLISATLALIFAVREVVRAHCARWAREALIRGATEALLRGDVLRASPLPEQDAEAAIFQGIYFGERLVTDVAPGLVGDLVAALVLAALLAQRLPARLVAVGLAALAAAALAIVVARRWTSRAVARADRAYVPVIEGIVAALGARLEMVASGRAAEHLADLRAETSRWAGLAMRADRLSSFAGRAPVLAAALGVTLALVAERAAHGDLDLDAFAEAAVFASAVPAFAGLARGALELTRISSKLAPYIALLDEEPAFAGGGRAPPALPADVSFRDVSYAYAGAPPAARALSRVTLTCRASRVMVLTGPNGSGKSTVLRVLLGLARPTEGMVKIDQTDLFSLDLAAWRREIAYLPQRPYLPVRATVRGAIRLIARDASDTDMRDALARAGLLGALEAKREDAPLEVVVGTLSAGQRQRLALARVLAQNARVFLLDEPDANLDAAGIRRVAELVRELAPGRLVIVAAHTRELVAAADDSAEVGPSA